MSTPAPPALRPAPNPAKNRIALKALATLAVGGLLATMAVNPAAAQPAPDHLLTATEAHQGSSAVSDIPDVAIAPPGEGIITRREDTPVAPGVSYTSFDRLDARGWLRGDILVADLDKHGVTVDYLNPGTVSGREVLSQQVARKGAIAGVNGDFFDINDTGARSASVSSGTRTAAPAGSSTVPRPATTRLPSSTRTASAGSPRSSSRAPRPTTTRARSTSPTSTRRASTAAASASTPRSGARRLEPGRSTAFRRSVRSYSATVSSSPRLPRLPPPRWPRTSSH